MKKAQGKYKKNKLPESFRPMFWSFRFPDIDPDKEAPLIIKQILAYGDLPEWRWMVKKYGRHKIKAVLSKTLQTELRPSLVELSKVAFNVRSMPYARGVPHARS